MNRSILLTAIICLTIGTTAGVLIQQHLTTEALSRKPERRSTSNIRPPSISSNAAVTEIAKMFSELPNLPSGEVGPVAISRFAMLAGRLDTNAFPYAARIALGQKPNSAEQMLTGLMRAWVNIDLAGAKSFMSGLSVNQRGVFVRSMAHALTRESQKSLAEFILESDDATLKDIGYAELGSKLRHLNPTNAYKVWLRLPDEWRSSQGWVFFSQWAHTDPIAAAKAMAPHAAVDRQLRSTMERAVSNWIQRDADEAVAFLVSLPDSDFRRELIAGTTPSLGQVAPQKGFELIRSLPAGSSRQRLMQQMLARWSDKNPAEAFDAARNFPEGNERTAALAATLERTAANSPDTLKSFMKAEPSNAALVENVEIFARHLVGTNSNVLMEWAGQLPSGRARDTVLARGIAGLDLVNPGEAVGLAQKHLPPHSRQLTVRTILNRWARNNAAEAAQFASQNLKGEERSSALATVAAEWVEKDLEAATTWLTSLPSSAERQPAEREVVRKLAASTPDKAAAFAATLPDSQHRGEMIAMALREWIKLDLKSAAEWLRALPTSHHNDNAYGIVAPAYLEIDAALAAELAERSPPNNGSQTTRIRFANKWAKLDPEASARWVVQLATNDIYISSCFYDVFGEWARRNPKVALRFLEESVLTMPTGFRPTLKNSCKQVAISHWADQEPETLLTYFIDKSPDLSKEETWKWVVSQWSRRDPAAVYKWLHEIADDKNRVLFTEHSLPFIAARQPNLAIQGLSLIPDPTSQDRVMESIYRTWNKLDGVGAKEWLRTNSLPASIKDRLTKELN